MHMQVFQLRYRPHLFLQCVLKQKFLAPPQALPVAPLKQLKKTLFHRPNLVIRVCDGWSGFARWASAVVGM